MGTGWGRNPVLPPVLRPVIFINPTVRPRDKERTMYCKRCGALTHYEADCTVQLANFPLKKPPKKAKAKKTKGKKK